MPDEMNQGVPTPAGNPQNPAPQQQVPPAYTNQPQQPMYQQQAQPANVAPKPLYELTGGMKFGWLVVGLLMTIPGMVLAWLVNVDKAPKVKSDAIKFAVIGFVISIVCGIIFGAIIGAMITAATSSLMGGYGYLS